MAAVGRVVRPRGLRGEVIVEPASADPVNLTAFKEVFIEGVDGTHQKKAVQKAQIHSGKVIMKFEGIEDRTTAGLLKGLFLLVPECKLPDLKSDEFYVHDVIGLAVENSGGDYLGRIIDVYEFPAHDVYVMKNDDDEILIPAVKQVIHQVDIDQKKMVVELPDDLPVYRKEKG